MNSIYIHIMKPSQNKIYNHNNQYDNDSQFSDDMSSTGSYDNLSRPGSPNLENDHMAFFKKSAVIADNQKYEKKILKEPTENGRSEYLSQFEELEFNNPSDPVSSNNIPQIRGKFADSKRYEMERDLALKGSYAEFNQNEDMKYGVIDEQNFVHNNMVPNFRSKLGKGSGPNSLEQEHINDTNQRKVNLFTGSSKDLSYRPKTERRPLFNPQVGETWIYGMPNSTDFMESRFIPSKEKRNEFLVQPDKVTPGLNKGYNEVSKDGYQPEYRALPKTVDDMRQANNPKVSYGSVVIPGLKAVKRSPIPNVVQYKPPKFVELDPHDMQKSLGYIRGPAVKGDIVLENTARAETTKEWYSPAEFAISQPTPENMMEKFKMPNRQTYDSAEPRNVAAIDKEMNTSNTVNTYYVPPPLKTAIQNQTYIPQVAPENKQSYAFDRINNIPDSTNRNQTENQNYIAHARSENQQSYAWDSNSNIPDPTRRNQTENQTYMTQISSEYKKNYAFDPTNMPDMTIRDQTQNQTYIAQIKPENTQYYAFNKENNIPDPTIRNQTENQKYIQQIGPQWLKNYVFDNKTNIPDSTIRQQLENNQHLNQISSMKQNTYAFDQKTNIPDPTQRQQMENTQYINQINPNKQQVYVFNEKTNIPAPTMRQQLENTQNLNQISTYKQPTYVFDKETNIPNPTLRQQIEHTQYLNQIQSSKQQVYVFDEKTNIPDPTMRQQLENNQYLNQISSNKQSTYVFDENTNMPDITKKQLLENNKYINQISSIKQPYYVFDEKTNMPQPTIRQQTENRNYMAPISDIQKQSAFDRYNNIPDPTNRQQTENKTYINPIGDSNQRQSAFDRKNNIPDPTNRQQTENKTYINPIGDSNQRSTAFDRKNNIPDPTIRQQTEKRNYINPIGDGNQRHYAFDRKNNVPDATMRQYTEITKQIGPASPIYKEKGGYQLESQYTTAPITIRQQTENTKDIGPAVSQTGIKFRTREDAINMKTNIAKDMSTIIRDGGAPTPVNYNIGPYGDFTVTELKTPINFNRDIYGSAIGQNPLQTTQTTYTRMPQQLDDKQGWHFDSFVKENLQGNIYINNPIHTTI